MERGSRKTERWRGGGGEAVVEQFCNPDFDAKLFVKDLYRNATLEGLGAFRVQVLEGKSAASHTLQRTVFRHYPKLIESGNSLREMESDLGLLRRNLGRTEFLLSSIETAASQLSKLGKLDDKNKHKTTKDKSNGKSEEGRESDAEEDKKTQAQVVELMDINMSRDLAYTRSALSEHAQLHASVEMSRFKKIQALLNCEDFENKFLLEAPNKLSLLLHYDAYDRAVDLIQEVRDANVDRLDASSFAFESYMEQDRVWALHFAKRIVEHKAAVLAEDLVVMLEKNQNSSSKYSAASMSSSLSSGSRRRTSSVSGENKQNTNRPKSERQNHPVRFLQRLGMQDKACTAFLRGKRNAIKELTDEIIYSPLATDPEQCILELAQTVFRGILETHIEFRQLFSNYPDARRALDTREEHGFPDSLLSYLMIWTKDQVAKYVTNFMRFLLPGSTAEQQGAKDDARLTLEEWERLEDLNTVSMRGIPFESEQQGGGLSLVLLSNDEWRVLGNCLRWSLLLCRKLEKDGVSLNFVVARQLKAPLNMALESIFTLAEKSLRASLSAEVWQATQLRVESKESTSESVLSLTSSGQKLYELVHDLIRKVKRVYSTNYSTTTASLESYIVSRTLSILNTYLENLVHAAGAWPVTLQGSADKFLELVHSTGLRGEGFQGVCKKIGKELTFREKRTVAVLLSKSLTTSQHLGMVADSIYVSSDLVGRVRENFEKLFKRTIGPFREFERKGDIENDASPTRMLCTAFVTRQSFAFLEDVLQWSHFDYSSRTSKSASADSPISTNFERLGTTLTDLKSLSLKLLGGHPFALDMVASISEYILSKLEAEGHPSAIFGPVEGDANKQRLTSDMYMLLNIPATVLDREPSESAKDIVTSILEKTKAI